MSCDHNTAAIVTAVVLSAALSGCSKSEPEPDFANNEGAVAWLAHHQGAVPRECINLMIERRGVSKEINADTRRQAHDDAMRIAGETYAVSRATDRLITAHENLLAIAREGYAKGYPVESAVAEAADDLNRVIYEGRIRRQKVAGLEACGFTATDAAFGFKERSTVR